MIPSYAMNVKITQDGLALLLGDKQCSCTMCLELFKHEGKAAASSRNDCQVLLMIVLSVSACFQSAISNCMLSFDV